MRAHFPLVNTLEFLIQIVKTLQIYEKTMCKLSFETFFGSKKAAFNYEAYDYPYAAFLR